MSNVGQILEGKERAVKELEKQMAKSAALVKPIPPAPIVREVHHYHEGQMQPANTDQIGKGNKGLPIPEGKTRTEEPRIDKQIAATATRYGINIGRTQQQAAQLLGTSDRTYRKYRDSDWLLSDDEFQKQTGMSLAAYWKKKISGK